MKIFLLVEHEKDRIDILHGSIYGIAQPFALTDCKLITVFDEKFVDFFCSLEDVFSNKNCGRTYIMKIMQRKGSRRRGGVYCAAS